MALAEREESVLGLHEVAEKLSTIMEVPEVAEKLSTVMEASESEVAVIMGLSLMK